MNFKKSFATAIYTFTEEGLYWVFAKTVNKFSDSFSKSVSKALYRLNLKTPWHTKDSFYDVIFINGCDYLVPHPIRYRVDHQMEQLIAAGYSCHKVEAGDLDDSYLRQARLFIIFRCPLTNEIESFIQKAKSLNKKILYDIDDLVIDTVYTNQIPYVQQMSQSDLNLYNEGVARMGQTLRLCDGAITTTAGLAEELKKYSPKVYINRNTASEEMYRLSEEAIYRRDVLPNLSDNQTPRHKTKQRALWRGLAQDEAITIGYFSGSISHNSDFEMILPILIKLLKKYGHLQIMIMGDLDIPPQLMEFKDRIIVVPFSSWNRIPFYLARCDINIAPLEDTIFNRAKSENKWVEAALVKVPTIASNIGAFAEMINNGETGILCDNNEDWEKGLRQLIESRDLRKKIGESAYKYCVDNCLTIYNTSEIKSIVDDNFTPNYAFIMPSLSISGGVLVALKHGCFLQQSGYDVSFIGANDAESWIEYEGCVFPILNRLVPKDKMDKCPLVGWFDNMIATLWDTLDFALRYPKVKRVFYLVQNYEVDFYLPNNPLRMQAISTYQNRSDVHFLTISSWCKKWLKSKFNVEAKIAPNGLDTARFYPIERNWNEKKIRILIEGDCGSEYKNIDEAFAIIDGLDLNKYEIWYMNYTGQTKQKYKIDNNLGCVPQEGVADIYRQCHILLKTSKLESFSYPPLEMMSTGGCVVARANEGNIEYLKDGYNCLFYDPENLSSACEDIDAIVFDETLRMTLIKGGLETAKSINQSYRSSNRN